MEFERNGKKFWGFFNYNHIPGQELVGGLPKIPYAMSLSISGRTGDTSKYYHNDKKLEAKEFLEECVKDHLTTIKRRK